MNCDDCPHHLADSDRCCHQSINPVPALIFTDATIATLRASWDKHYEQLGVWHVLEQRNLV